MIDNTYQKHTGPSVASHKNAKHLSEKEKEALASLMSDFEGLLKGTVGDYKEMEVSFEVKNNKIPYHAKPYRIPVAHTQMMKTAIKEMYRNKALEEYNGDSEWAAPTFGVPKKNDGVRIVTDFRKLNEAIKRNPWPMLTIQDMLHQCGGVTYATALELIQSYYAMNIKKNMQKYLVIILPWGSTSS